MNREELKSSLMNMKDSVRFITAGKRYVFFTPGLLLMALGLGVVLFPRLFLIFFAGFFLMLGGIACLVVWKLLKLKQKFEQISRDFKGQLIVQGIRVDGAKFEATKSNQSSNLKQTNLFEEPIAGDLSLTDLSAKDSKKIIFH